MSYVDGNGYLLKISVFSKSVNKDIWEQGLNEYQKFIRNLQNWNLTTIE